MKHIAVVGGSLAGVSAIEGLRSSGFDGDITIVDAETVLPYDKPPLSKQALLQRDFAEQLALHPRAWYEERGVVLRLGQRAVGLDASSKTVYLDGGAEIVYDGLLIATGAAARTLPALSGVSDRIHLLRTLDDSVRLRAELIPGRRVLVIGAGFIGLEVAAAARQLGLDVTIVECAPTPLYRAFGAQLGGWFHRLHLQNGVTIHCGVSIVDVNTTSHGVAVRLNDDSMLTADVVVSGVGAAPQTSWLADSGLVVSDGIRCSRDLSTNAPGIVAAGDVARWYNSLFREEIRIEHWSNAVEQGRHAAITLLGESTAYCEVPYFWTDQYGARVRFVGRASADDDVVIDEAEPNKLVALFGRDGLLRGAACINAPLHLARYREAIASRTPWRDCVGELTGSAMGTLIGPGSSQA